MMLDWFVAVLAIAVVVTPVCESREVQGTSIDGRVFLYAIPFEAETFVPIRKGDIESKANCVIELERDGVLASRLADLLSRSKRGRLNDYLIRLKVVGLSEEPFFLDGEGGVSQGDEQWSLKRKAFRDLKAFVEQLASEQCEDDYVRREWSVDPAGESPAPAKVVPAGWRPWRAWR